ncbi:MAG: aldo/keto reductase [Candidatus Brocadiia bacterium]
MQYAQLGETGLKVSRLGFGCMRLPMTDGGEVDREKAIPMLRRAVDLGINYFDTAVGYCGGDSQRALGEAMEDIRDQVVLSTKNHHYDKDDKDQWWQHLEDSLERLRTDHIDIYNFHGMNYERFEQAVAGDDGLYQEMLKAKEQGLIRHICHSFHGSLESLKKCVDTGLFQSVTLQYNLLDQRLEEGIAYAAEHGMGVVVMGPVGGGRLGYPSEKAQELVGEVKSTPELALRFVLSNPNVTLALSGMSTMEMLEENVETASKAGELSQEDQDKIKAAVEERKKLAGLYCTGCNYCMPCPAGVDIPANFEALNLERVFGLSDHARSKYRSLSGKAALCRLCGKCVEECPQELDIPARLAEAVAVLDERAGSVGGWVELRGARMDEQEMLHLDARYNLKNYTDQDRDVAVEFEPHMEEQVRPTQLEQRTMTAYARSHEDVDLVVRPPVEAVSLDARLRYDGTERLEHYTHVAALARKADDYDLNTEARRTGTTHAPSPMHPLVASGDMPEGHSYDFVASWDDENLYVWVDVEDDLLKPAEAEAGRRTSADKLAIFVDGRKPAEIGQGGYGDGVAQVTIFPPAEENGQPQVHVRGKGEVDVALTRTGTGYRVDCAIPWTLFSQVDGAPSVIGFDMVMESYEEDGDRALRLSWTGRGRQERNPGSFGRLLLV